MTDCYNLRHTGCVVHFYFTVVQFYTWYFKRGNSKLIFEL